MIIEADFKIYNLLTIPIVVFSKNDYSKVFSNSFVDNFDWNVSTLKSILGEKDIDKDIKDLFKNKTLEKAVEVRGDKNKRFIFILCFTLQDDFIFCYGKDSTELSEQKLLIKSFTSMVEDANKKLKAKSLELSNVLNTMKQATFMVNNTGRIISPVSAFSKEIFHQEIEGENLFDILYSKCDLTEDSISSIKSEIETAFDEDILQWELSASNIPRKLVYNFSGTSKRDLLVDAYPLFNDSDNLFRILFVVQDVTELLFLKQENLLKEQKVIRIKELTDIPRDRLERFFTENIRSVEKLSLLINSLNDNLEDLSELSRITHILKGNSRLYNFSLISQAAHELENIIERYLLAKSESLNNKLIEEFLNLDNELRLYTEIAKNILRLDVASVQVSSNRFILKLVELDKIFNFKSTDDPAFLFALTSLKKLIEDTHDSDFLEVYFSFTKEMNYANFQNLGDYFFSNYGVSSFLDYDYIVNSINFISELMLLFEKDDFDSINLSSTLRSIYSSSNSFFLRTLYESYISKNISSFQKMKEFLYLYISLVSNYIPSFYDELLEKSNILNFDISFDELDKTTLFNESNKNLALTLSLEEQALVSFIEDTKLKEIQIRKEEIQKIIDEVSNSSEMTNDKIIERLRQLTYVSFNDKLDDLRGMAMNVANSCHKKVELSFEGEEVKIPDDYNKIIQDALIHLVTNAVDHGIESVDERLSLNKDETGKIIITSYIRDQFLCVSVRDDGSGIDTDSIKDFAISNKLINLSDKLKDELVQEIIFSPGFSTKKTVTLNSGRGIGLNAVQRSIQTLDATIEYSYAPLNFCEFLVKIPITWMTN